jgi:hypothetical protein
MDAAVSGVCLRQTPMPKSGRTPDFGTRKGLEGFSRGAERRGRSGSGAPESPVRPAGPDAPKFRECALTGFSGQGRVNKGFQSRQGFGDDRLAFKDRTK